MKTLKHFSILFLVFALPLFMSNCEKDKDLLETSENNLKSAAAGEFSLEDGIVVFGPEVYVRGKGKPEVITKTIEIENYEHFETFTIVIENGDENGDQRVSSAEVKINGEVIFDPSDFGGKKKAELKKELNLSKTFGLQVEVRGGLGSYFNVSILGSLRESSYLIGTENSIIEFDDPLHNLFGVRIEFSFLSQNETTIVSVNENLSPPTLDYPNSIIGAPVIDVTPEDPTLIQAALITLPITVDFDPVTQTVFGLFYDEEENQWEPSLPVNFDETELTLTFSTDHFSLFSLIVFTFPFTNEFIGGILENSELYQNLKNEVQGLNRCDVIQAHRELLIAENEILNTAMHELDAAYSWCYDNEVLCWFLHPDNFNEWATEMAVSLGLEALVGAFGVTATSSLTAQAVYGIFHFALLPATTAVALLTYGPCELCLLATGPIQWPMLGQYYVNEYLIWCIDNLENECNSTGPQSGTFIDPRDGIEYKIVQIGNQVWMAENLRATIYPDGTPISLVEGTSEWSALDINDAAYCWMNNDIDNRDLYGGLYTWAAAMHGAASSNANPSGIQGVCPDGWHLPSDDEWSELGTFLGYYNAGSKLKEEGNEHWLDPNDDATNEYGFTALPSGARSGIGGGWVNFLLTAYYGSATEVDATQFFNRALDSRYTILGRAEAYKEHGFSVRCVKD